MSTVQQNVPLAQVGAVESQGGVLADQVKFFGEVFACEALLHSSVGEIRFHITLANTSDYLPILRASMTSLYAVNALSSDICP